MLELNVDLSLCLGSSGDHQQYWQVKLDVVPAPTQSSVRRESPEIAARQIPAVERESEEEAVISSPNSMLSIVSGKRGHAMTISSGGGETIFYQEDDEGSRKKLRLSKDQCVVLEESFKEHNTLNPKQKQALARQLNLRPRQVEVWFQNRRARTKLRQTEVDCEFLKRCCENLTDENRKLQKEVAELRGIKLPPQFYMQMAPPATLTMCPSCERVAPTNNGSATLRANVDHPYLQHTGNQQTLPVVGSSDFEVSFLDVVNTEQS